jgi:hypothetical protein
LIVSAPISIVSAPTSTFSAPHANHTSSNMQKLLHRQAARGALTAVVPSLFLTAGVLLRLRRLTMTIWENELMSIGWY